MKATFAIFFVLAAATARLCGVAPLVPGPSAPTILRQPADTSVKRGGVADFEVTAFVTPAPTYQWRKNGVNISGATTSSLRIKDVEFADAGNYDVIVTNSLGTVTSRPATLTVTSVITSQPADVTAAVGDTATFSVGATGTNLTYQWYKNGILLPGATNSYHTITHANTSYMGFYKVVVGSVAASAGLEQTASDVAILTIGALSTDSTYAFSTLAGAAGKSGSADGAGAAARFDSPEGIAVDGSGNVIVADQGNETIRKITAEGNVTTLAGVVNSIGFVDGPGSKGARFYFPTGVAADESGNVFVADSGNRTIRKITAEGIVSTWAGAVSLVVNLGENPNPTTNVDGTGNAARFGWPTALALDRSGSLFVSDSSNYTIRKITAGGVVTTLAGTVGIRGSADGSGSAARFGRMFGVAADGSGNLFVADSENFTIRRITAEGLVTTLAGSPESSGYADGIGSAARFFGRGGVAVDDSGNVFVADSGNSVIRKITPAGVVSTIGGLFGHSGSSDGVGSAARFAQPYAVAVDRAGNLYIGDIGNNTIRVGRPVLPLFSITTPPQSQHVNAGSRATLVTTTAGANLTYQWKKNGGVIAGATSSTYVVASASAADMGFYSVEVSGPGGSIVSPVAILTVATGTASRLSNISTRGLVPTDSDITVGFVIRGGGSKSLLVRAVGPTLEGFGVIGALADPRLELFPAGANSSTISNDNWGGGAALANAFADAGAFALPTPSKDAALVIGMPAAAFSAQVTSSLVGGFGLALAEIYDRDAPGAASRLVNVSTRGFVGAGAEALAPGFVIDGTAPKRLLIRAVGPGLTPFGVTGALADPQLGVIPAGQSFTVASNDNWDGTAATAAMIAQAGAFPLTPGSKDAVIVVRLPPGGYTVTVSGINNTTGIALVEIYDLDP